MDWVPVLADVIAGPMILLGLAPIILMIVLVVLVVVISSVIAKRRKK